MVRPARLWAALAPAMLVPTAASLAYFVAFSDTALGRIIYVAAKAFLVLWPLACVWLLFGRALPRLDVRAPHHYRAIPLGIGVGLALVALMVIAMLTPIGTVVEQGGPSIGAKIDELGLVDYYWPFAVFISVIHSFIEEYYWRWFVYGTLRTRLGMGSASVLASASFAGHHVVIATQFFPLVWGVVFGLAVGVGGAVWCVMFERQRTLVGIWIAHLMADLGIMTIGYAIAFG